MISIKTVGYYHRDSNEFKVTPDLLPRTLNSNKRFFENPIPLPFINLNIDVPDSGADELKMESLLKYINLKGFPNDTPPQFVTNRHLLKTIAAPREDELLEVVGIRKNGVVYLLKVSSEASIHKNFGAIFERFWLNEIDDGTVRKGVFLAEIPGSTEHFSVMYSGEIDAIDDSGNHLEFKVLSGGLNEYFWKYSKFHVYWQAFLGNAETLIIGTRTGRTPNDKNTLPPMNIPEWSVHKVQKLQRRDILKPWEITKSEERLSGFFEHVQNVMKSDGDAFLFTRLGFRRNWRHFRNFKKTAEFQKTLDELLLK